MTHVRRANPREQRHVVGQPPRRARDQHAAIVQFGVRIFGGGAAEADAVDAGVDQELEVTIECREIERARFRDWCGDGREQARECPHQPVRVSVFPSSS